MHLTSHFALLALLAALPAQNLVPNGEFHDGNAGWTLNVFNDPLGTTGFAAARTAGNGPSMAVFADFQTLTAVMTATYQGPQVQLPQGPLPVGFRVMWQKQVTAPIQSPTLNRVELRIFDHATNQVVYVGTQQSPNQTGLLERASFNAVATIPTAGTYSFIVFMRHSNVVGIPFTTWVDDVYCGGLVTEFFGQGCAGSGGFVPVIGSSNAPFVGSNNFRIELDDALGPTLAVFLVDTTNTTWSGGALPFPIGGGCSLLVGGAASLFHLITTNGPGTGSAAQTFAIPANPAFGGLNFFAQWGVLDPAAPNPFGFVSTAGFRFTTQ